MKSRFLFLQSSSPAQKAIPLPSCSLSSSPSRHRSCLLVNLLFFFTVAFLFFLLLSFTHPSPTSPLHPPSTTTTPTSSPPPPPLPSPFFDALVHYAALSSSGSPGAMPDPDIRAAAAVLGRRVPCNLLVFGLGHESPLWLALNHDGHSVFLDPSEALATGFEDRHRRHYPGLEAYSANFPTRVADLRPLLTAAREESSAACRPVQDLLFSDCRLALTDLPNHLYRIEWDVVLIDGPPGYHPAAPGRAAAIFTAAVLARSVGGEGATDVLVHDYDRQAEKASGEEFLCAENLVGSTGGLAHFVIHRGGPQSGGWGFCRNRTAAAAAAVDL